MRTLYFRYVDFVTRRPRNSDILLGFPGIELFILDAGIRPRRFTTPPGYFTHGIRTFYFRRVACFSGFRPGCFTRGAGHFTRPPGNFTRRMRTFYSRRATCFSGFIPGYFTRRAGNLTRFPGILPGECEPFISDADLFSWRSPRVFYPGHFPRSPGYIARAPQVFYPGYANSLFSTRGLFFWISPRGFYQAPRVFYPGRLAFYPGHAILLFSTRGFSAGVRPGYFTRRPGHFTQVSGRFTREKGQKRPRCDNKKYANPGQNARGEDQAKHGGKRKARKPNGAPGAFHGVPGIPPAPLALSRESRSCSWRRRGEGATFVKKERVAISHRRHSAPKRARLSAARRYFRIYDISRDVSHFANMSFRARQYYRRDTVETSRQIPPGIMLCGPGYASSHSRR